MSIQYNVYCDESCHLENDKQKAMVLGLVWCDKTKRKEISNRINEIKQKHNLPKTFEIKWTKISPSKVDFYYFETIISGTIPTGKFALSEGYYNVEIFENEFLRKKITISIKNNTITKL